MTTRSRSLGTSSRARLEENIGALDVPLTKADLDALDAISPLGVAAGARYHEAGLNLIDH